MKIESCIRITRKKSLPLIGGYILLEFESVSVQNLHSTFAMEMIFKAKFRRASRVIAGSHSISYENYWGNNFNIILTKKTFPRKVHLRPLQRPRTNRES